MLATWGADDMQYVISLPGWSYYYKILNLFEFLEWVCPVLYFASCRHGAFDLSSVLIKLSCCETARWPKGACETSRYYAAFCFMISKDPVKKAVRSISAKTWQKHTKSSPCYCLPFIPCGFASYRVLVYMHFSQVTALQEHWMYRLLWSTCEKVEES